MPHGDRELGEIGDLLPQIREIVVHVASVLALPVSNVWAGNPIRRREMDQGASRSFPLGIRNSEARVVTRHA